MELVVAFRLAVSLSRITESQMRFESVRQKIVCVDWSVVEQEGYSAGQEQNLQTRGEDHLIEADECWHW